MESRKTEERRPVGLGENHGRPQLSMHVPKFISSSRSQRRTDLDQKGDASSFQTVAKQAEDPGNLSPHTHRQEKVRFSLPLLPHTK